MNYSDSSTHPDETHLIHLPKEVESAYKGISIFILMWIMFSMGCAVDVRDIKSLLLKPYPAIVGLLSQFVIMPACAFGFANVLSLSPLHSIALMVVASCPGGTLSNVFTFWTRGDISLSIFMTLISTALALAFMPLNLFLYLKRWTDNKLKIPFVQTTMLVFMTWIPVIFGLIIRFKNVKIADFIAKVVIILGSVLGLIFIVGGVIFQIFFFPRFLHLETSSWVASTIMPLLGFIVGFLAPSVARLDCRQRRTIAIETSFQNTAIAMVLIAVSFEMNTISVMSQIPTIFLVSQICWASLLTFIHRIYFWLDDKRKEEKDNSKELIDERKAASEDGSDQGSVV
ncbi:hypothetical protein CAPTEDRAFT_101762 [Capitella teleta]|uniref:Uncharacterized protein n=1 Tax=Capitella teleta TaxID=283909 RepID=R7UH33_CAPTE|nr:hypothetical protein CAPTEDRAFT_101762 [Capitella teleta]|eukprot:ELU03108.1 hypothetical protein CAPTEDRAFT_101762 [Capitella teleta]